MFDRPPSTRQLHMPGGPVHLAPSRRRLPETSRTDAPLLKPFAQPRPDPTSQPHMCGSHLSEEEAGGYNCSFPARHSSPTTSCTGSRSSRSRKRVRVLFRCFQERVRVAGSGSRAAEAAAMAEGASSAPAAAAVAGEGDGKMTMVVGIDDSEHSFYALQWALQHFFAPGRPHEYRLAVVNAKPTAASAIGLAGPGAAEVLPFVEADLKRTSMRVIDKAKDLCKQVSDAVFEVVEGDARNVLCEAVERHHAEMLVLGSHGYGAIKRAVLGSVSDYCAHHAHCTVMIVKKPKHKH
ncbi:hypothetical protein ACP70R_023930 [Stipagrostis hirtigluma subsp. patula]